MSFETDLSKEQHAELIKRCNLLMDEIATKGESAETRVRLANVHLKLGEREEAVMCLQTALSLRPDTPAILSKLRGICTEEEFERLDIPRKPEPFWSDIPGLLRYPLSGSGPYLLIGGTIFVTILQFIISLPTFFFYATIMLSIFLSGYLSAYFISIMRSSARGRANPPDWPDITDIMGTVFRSLLIVLLPTTLSFFPAIAYSIYCLIYGGSLVILVGLIVFGALYYPMALVASAITGAPLNALNFIGVINSIMKVRKDYFIALLILALMGGLGVIAYVAAGLATQIIYGSLATAFALRFVYLYFMMAYAHILGLLYRQCGSRISS